MMKLFTTSLTLCFLSVTSLFSQGSTFSFTTTGFNAQQDSAIDYCGQIWGQYLNSNVPIKVNVYYATLGVGTTLAVTMPNGRRDFANAPLDSTWYPSCLANSLADVELNPGESDMDIFVNNTVNWYWLTDGASSPGKYDFVTVFLHEIGHGLGFLSLAKLQDTIGSFGYITEADITPLITSFPFPDLQGKYSVFSSFMENGSGQSLTDTLIFPNPSVLLGDEFVSNDLFFNGPLSYVVNGNAPVRLYAPSTYAPGSSMEHINEATFPAGNPNTLMTPFVSNTEVHHSPGPLTIAMLEDMGWTVNHDIGIDNDMFNVYLEVFPNPVISTAYLRLNRNVNNEKISIYDMSGRLVYTNNISVEKNEIVPVNLEELISGVYVISILGNSFKLIKA